VSVPLVAALDIGGTKTAGALVDTGGRIRLRARRPTPAGPDPEAVMAAVRAVLAELAASPLWHRAGAVGIGCAGPLDLAAGTAAPVNIPAWRGFPLVERVRRAAGGRPVTLAGDALAVAAAEHRWGAARGLGNALCAVVSTGVGGGLILGGRLHPGPTGNAGHIGHIPVELDGAPCACGGRGCVETVAAGPAVLERALRSGWRPSPGRDRSAAAVAESARAGDPRALDAFERAGRALAAGFAATAATVELDAAVVGGGVAAAGEVLLAPLRRGLAEYAGLPFVRRLVVLPARAGTDAGLIGAAALALDVAEPGGP
jgi:glucokinase